MPFEYSGWIEVPRNRNGEESLIRVPFRIPLDILPSNDELDLTVRNFFSEWVQLLIGYDARRKNEFGEIVRINYTGVIQISDAPNVNRGQFGRGM